MMDEYMLEEIAMTVIPIITSAVPSAVLSIVSYVLSSLALYTMAARRGIDKAWLSWVPVINVWIIGSLSDQYRYVVKGQYKSKRKVLLVLNLLSILLTVVMVIGVIIMVVNVINDTVYGISGEDVVNTMMGTLFAEVALVLPLAGIAIAAAVIRYMALYDIYTSVDPVNNVLFLVLSILFGVTEPFFLFFSRNSDAGMPPRKTHNPQP